MVLSLWTKKRGLVGLGRHYRGYDAWAKYKGMCSKQWEREEGRSRQREWHEQGHRYLQVVWLR